MGKAYIVRQKFTCEGKPDFWRTHAIRAASPRGALDAVITGYSRKRIISPGDWTNYKSVNHYEVWEDTFNLNRVRAITRATMVSLEGCRKLITRVDNTVTEHPRFWVVKAPELSVNSEMPIDDLSGEQIAEKAKPEEVVYEYRRVRAPTLEEALKRAGFRGYSSDNNIVYRWYDTGSSIGARTLAASEKYPWQVFSDAANSEYARSEMSDLSPIAELTGPGADNWKRRAHTSALAQPAASTQAIAPPPNVMRLWIVAEERATHDGACVANNATCWVVNLVQAIDETNAIRGANESPRAGLHNYLTYAPLCQGRTGNFIENGRMIAVQVDDSWAKYEGRTHEAQEPLREFARTCRVFIDAGVDDKLHEHTRPAQTTDAADHNTNRSDPATPETPSTANLPPLWLVAEQRHRASREHPQGIVFWCVQLVHAPNELDAKRACNDTNIANSRLYNYASLDIGVGDSFHKANYVVVRADESWRTLLDDKTAIRSRLLEEWESVPEFVAAGVYRGERPLKVTAAATSTTANIAASASVPPTTSTKETTMSKLTETLKTFANQTRDDASQGAKIAAGIKATKFLQRIITTRVVPNLPSFVEGYATEAVNSVYGGAVVSFLGGVALPHITTRFLDDKPQEFVEQTAKTMREQAFAGVFVELADLVGEEISRFFTREQQAAEREARRAAEREQAELQSRTGVRAEDLFERAEGDSQAEKAELKASVFSGSNGRANGTSHSS